MSGWEQKGCTMCRRAMLSGSWPPPDRIAVDPKGPIFLHCCERCDSFWEAGLREAHVISAEEAKRRFPDVLAE